MRIGLARRGFSPTGGAEAYLKRLGATLRSRNHEPVLLCDPAWPETEWRHGPRIEFPRGSVKNFSDAIRSAEKRWDVLFSLERISGCDVYRAGDGVHAAWLKRRARFEPRWQSLARAANPKHLEILAIEKQLFAPGGAQRIIVNSLMVSAELERFYGVAPERIDLVYNGVPPVPMVTAEERFLSREEFGLPHAAFVVLFVGSGWERKGLEFALHAFEQLPSNIVLLVAGRGKPPRRHPSNVRFVGPFRPMRQAYATADLFLLPTLYDPFSNATLEAAAHGLPIITTAANGFHELLDEEETGHVLTRPDAVDEIRATIRHWKTTGVCAAVRKRVAHSVSHLTMDANVDATLRCLEKATGAAAT